MNAKEYLESVRAASMQLEELLCDERMISGDAEAVRRLEAERREFIRIREQGRRLIRTLREDKYSDEMQVILLYRYVDGLSWGEIIKKTRYEKSRIFYWHKQALQKLEKLRTKTE